MNKKFLFGIRLLLAMNIFAVALSYCNDEEVMRNLCEESDEQCCNSLNIKDLCAKKIKAKQGLFREACVHSLKSRSICAENLGVTCDVGLTNVCAHNLTTSTLCVTGTARLNEVCGLYRASVGLANDTLYTLGNPVEYDLITDDPNNNVHLAPFYYEAPVSGYYIASMQVDSRDLMGTALILGVPVSNLQLLVNGVERRQSFIPFLTFNNFQFAELSFLLSLQAGDKLTVKYEVLVVDSISGTIPYVGTTTLISGIADKGTIFKIHYLSSDCNPAVCQPCHINPVPCNIDCHEIPSSCAPRP